MALLIDEIQLLSQAELAALILSMHKLQQKQAPLVLVGAGLPTLPRLAGDAKSYAERLFSYPVIGTLNQQETRDALNKPANQEGACFTAEATSAIFKQTKGYPYFLQEWGYQVWKQSEHPHMTVDDVEAATGQVTQRLDSNFFRVRYDRLTEGEKRFMHAMAACGKNGVCKSSDVADCLHMKSSTITPTRANLIKKGMIYSPRHGLLDYSVPLFGEFLQRADPDYLSLRRS